MALIVTFTRVDRLPNLMIPVEVADEARTERIAIDSGTDGLDSAQGTLEATDNENILSLYAQEACWVTVAKPDGQGSPVARPGEGRYMAAGERIQLSVKPGHRVAVTGVEVA